jgi:hypothetical protein
MIDRAEAGVLRSSAPTLIEGPASPWRTCQLLAKWIDDHHALRHASRQRPSTRSTTRRLVRDGHTIGYDYQDSCGHH